jgi:hypothetical protein
LGILHQSPTFPVAAAMMAVITHSTANRASRPVGHALIIGQFDDGLALRDLVRIKMQGAIFICLIRISLLYDFATIRPRIVAITDIIFKDLRQEKNRFKKTFLKIEKNRRIILNFRQRRSSFL